PLIVDLRFNGGGVTTELETRHAGGEYDDPGTLAEFTGRLTEELREISGDLHVLILPYEKLPDYRFEDRLVGEEHDNFGFRRVERLPGNIGYLRLDKFYNTLEAGDTAVAAMNFLAHCDALIVDLRFNGGGDTTMAQLISSYFFDKPQLLNRCYTRHSDLTEESWTFGYVPGPRLTEVPVYILLSRFSFSCAEGFAYELKHLGRATIVGEQTKGGGHAVTYKSYPDDWVNIRVPVSRDINPVTGASLQGTGVAPDIKSSMHDAFATANVAALEGLLAGESNEARKFKLQWALDEYNAALHPTALEGDVGTGYVGQYGERAIVEMCGELVYKRPDLSSRTLLPMGGDLFTLKSERRYSSYRIQFVRDKAGAVSGFYLTDDDGDPSEIFPRSE
ncbi:S41 family peptidase, partial [Acidobacteriota bacterium]